MAAALLLAGSPAYAEPTPPPPAECSDPGFICNYDGTQWNVDAPDSTRGPIDPFPSADGPSPGGMFALFAIFAVVIGGGTLWWRLSTARRIAEQAGLDPDTAVTTTLLSEDGLAATYLAANLRPQPQPAYERPVGHLEPPSSRHTAESRLTELKALHDQGLITDQDYDRRRTEILNGV